MLVNTNTAVHGAFMLVNSPLTNVNFNTTFDFNNVLVNVGINIT